MHPPRFLHDGFAARLPTEKWYLPEIRDVKYASTRRPGFLHEDFDMVCNKAAH